MSETPAGCCRTDRRLAEARWGADSRCGRAAAAQGFLAGPSGELPAAGVDGAQGHSAGRVLGRRAAPSPCPPHAAALPAYHGRSTSLQASGRLAAGDAGHSLSSRLAPACFAASEGLRALPLPRPECTRRPAGRLVCCGVQKLQPPTCFLAPAAASQQGAPGVHRRPRGQRGAAGGAHPPGAVHAGPGRRPAQLRLRPPRRPAGAATTCRQQRRREWSGRRCRSLAAAAALHRCPWRPPPTSPQGLGSSPPAAQVPIGVRAALQFVAAPTQLLAGCTLSRVWVNP